MPMSVEPTRSQITDIPALIKAGPSAGSTMTPQNARKSATATASLMIDSPMTSTKSRCGTPIALSTPSVATGSTADIAAAKAKSSVHRMLDAMPSHPMSARIASAPPVMIVFMTVPATAYAAMRAVFLKKTRLFFMLYDDS